MSPRTRRLLALVAVPVAIVLATLVTMLLLPDLPDPVAVHVGPDGVADGVMSRTGAVATVVALQVGVGALLAVLVSAVGRQVAGGRAALALPAAVVALLGTVFVVMLAAQRGLADATDATLGFTAVPVAMAVALGVGVLTGRLAPPSPPAAPATGTAPADLPRTDLGGGSGVWHGPTRPGRAVPAVAAGVVVLGVVLAWFAGAVVLPLLLLPLLALVASVRFTVTVGPAGVAVRGVLGWPRTQVPLTTITHADVEDVHPMAYGGWGWRMRTDRTAVVTSTGPGLVVHRSDGASLVVTVDGADEAAGVVNRLVDRREAARAADPA